MGLPPDKPSCAGAWFDRVYPGAVHPEGRVLGGTSTVVRDVNLGMGFGRVEPIGGAG